MDLLFFDIETTGTNVDKDRIVQLATKIVTPDGNVKMSKSNLINPTIPITEQALLIHGITDDIVKDKPTFKHYAPKLKPIFENKIIVTYNGMRFDIPLLMKEFERAGVKVKLSNKFIDVMKVDTLLYPRSLSGLYKKYTGNDLEAAHDAMKDVDATEVIFNAHWDLIGKPGDPNIIDKLIDYSGTKELVDYGGKFKRDNEGYLVVNFGKKALGKRLIDVPEFANWMLKEEFSSEVKELVKQEQKLHNPFTFKKPVVKQESINFGNINTGLPTIDRDKKYSTIRIEDLPDDDLPF